MKPIVTALWATILLLIVTGGLYPLAVDMAGHLLFSGKANGSLLTRGETVIGSSLIGQSFVGPQYFHSRPSATPDPTGSGSVTYDGAFSSASNLAPTNGAQIKAVNQTAADYRKENGLFPAQGVPADAVTASGSELDPDITLANALSQVQRVAKALNMDLSSLKKRVLAIANGPQWGILGERRVNVLKLNMFLDGNKNWP